MAGAEFDKAILRNVANPRLGVSGTKLLSLRLKGREVQFIISTMNVSERPCVPGVNAG